MPTKITSPHNRHIKDVLQLAKRRRRDVRQATVVEGVREVQRALSAGVLPIEAYVCPTMVRGAESDEIVARLYQLDEERVTHLFEIPPEIFAKLTYRGESGGLLLIIPYVGRRLTELPVGSPPFLIVMENVEKPGNLGAILRTADAAGVDGVLVCSSGDTRSDGRDPDRQVSTDVHNPNVIRASLGTLFHIPIVETSSQAAIEWLQQRQIQIIATTPDATLKYTRSNMGGPVAIVMGSEAWGLGQAWLDAADTQVYIPMHGIADSLNLSTATALLLYEVVRQRELG